MKRVGLVALLTVACGAEPKPPAHGVATGAVLYSTHCTLCHGHNGAQGLGGAKDLSVSVLSAQAVKQIVTKGKGAMAAYEHVLTPTEIDSVAQHVLTLRH
jgi:mono/diheme cytochrome c family protein